MPSAVEVLFSSKGVKEVLGDIGNIQKALERMHGATGRAADRGGASQVSAARKTSGAVVNIAARERAAKEREFAAYARTLTKAENDTVKTAKKAADERVKTNAKENAEKNRQNAAYARQREQIVQNSLRMEDRSRTAAARAHETAARTRGATYGGAIGRGVGNVVGMAARVGGAIATIGGGFTIADALGGRMREEAAAGQIVRSAANTGGETKGSVMHKARATAISTGGTTDDVLGGIDAFVMKTGELGAGVQMIERLSKVAAASGTALSDMGSTAAEVFSAMEGTAEQKMAGTMKAILALAGQGKAGAIDIRNLGQYGARLTASAHRFKGDTGANIESLGAIAQLAKGGGGATDAAESTEAVARLADDMVEHSAKFAALGHGGVNVFTDKSKTKLRGVEDIITESITHSGGDLSKLSGMYGVRSMKGVESLRNTYTEAGGGAAGERAIRAKFANAKSVRMTEDEANKGTADKLTETQAKLNVAMIKVNEAFADKLAPMLPGLIDKFAALAPAMANLIQSLIAHPWAGLGLAVTASITKEIAAAKIGEGISSLIARLTGAPPVPGGAGGKGVPLLAAGAAGFGLGALLAEHVIDPALNGRERGQRRVDIMRDNLATVESGVKSGKLSPEMARKFLAEQQNTVTQAGVQQSGIGAAMSGGNVAKATEEGWVATSAKLKSSLDSLAGAIDAKAAEVAGAGSLASADSPNRGLAAPQATP